MKKSNVNVSVLSVSAAAMALVTACNGGGSSSASSAGNIAATCSARKANASIQRLVMAHTAQAVSHIPKAVQSLSDVGGLAQQSLPITVSLNLNNESDLEEKLTAMYDPANPNYGKYMSPEQFRASYAPTADQVQQVQTYLAANGVQGLSVNSNGYMISGKATTQALNTMLQTDIHQYKDASGKAFFAPSIEPVMPKGLPIQAIHGLNNVTQRHHYAQQLKAEAATPKSGTGHSGAFSPTDIKVGYNMPTSVNGSGQVLGLFELDGFNQSDITAYESYYSLPASTVTPVSVDSQNTSSPGGGIGEVTLDIELQLAVAPAATVLVYEGPNSDQGMIDTYAAIANDNKAKSISTSWGSSEGGTASSFQQSENTIFMQMAAQGQSIFSAAGDSGADDNGSSLSVDDPSSQPYMTAVGGTSLTLGSGSAYGSETTWTSGGGGISTAWTIPSYQSGIATSSNLASSTMRNIPDVAVNADPSTGYDIYVSGGWGTWGGTSAAAPIWAGFMALVNEQRASGGQGTIGFVNPAIYALGKGQNYSSDFHDIADGSTNGHYPAETGYDDATGWGSMNGQNLFEDLSSGAVPTSGC